MDIIINRTQSNHPDFTSLVNLLDIDLAEKDGDEHEFYAQFNKINLIQHVVVAYSDNEAVGCGAIKQFDTISMEVKRMYVLPEFRKKGIAQQILRALEMWEKELGYKQTVLETGLKQQEAIQLYTKYGYQVMPNYGQYIGVENSICFMKPIE